MTQDDFRILRRTAGMTQEQFGNALGLTRETINKIENFGSKLDLVGG